jgi:hypothetical protein
MDLPTLSTHFTLVSPTSHHHHHHNNNNHNNNNNNSVSGGDGDALESWGWHNVARHVCEGGRTSTSGLRSAERSLPRRPPYLRADDEEDKTIYIHPHPRCHHSTLCARVPSALMAPRCLPLTCVVQQPLHTVIGGPPQVPQFCPSLSTAGTSGRWAVVLSSSSFSHSMGKSASAMMQPSCNKVRVGLLWTDTCLLTHTIRFRTDDSFLLM